VDVLYRRASVATTSTQRDAYPDSSKMTAVDIEHAPEVPSIPPLLSQPET
jgi:hypothetical protein